MSDAVIIRGEGGRFLPGTRTPKPITRANAHEFARMRKEKTARLMREQLIAAHERGGMEPVGSAPEVAAASAALLYEEIVLDKNQYARDRRETWLTIMQAAGLVATPADARQAEQAGPAVGDVTSALYALGAGAADAIIALLREQSQARIVVADVVDAEDIVVE